MRNLLMMLLLASVALGQDKIAPQQGPPPSKLTRLADGHFSANVEPENPDRFDVHIVKQGETLSWIAAQTLKNPLLWPQLWEQNEHIISPHWIYPNDKILVRPVTQITEATPPPAIEPPPPAPAPPPAPVAAPPRPQAAAQPVIAPTPAPVQDVFILTPPKSYPEVKAADLYCSGFVQLADVPEDNKVIAIHDASAGALATEMDYIYLSQGGLRQGDIFNVVRPTKRINNLGTHYLEVAQLQVVMPQTDFALARVVHSCEAIELGDLVLPFQRMAAPALQRPRTFNPFYTGSSGIIGSVVVSLNVLSNFGSVFRAAKTTPGVRGGDLGALEGGAATEGTIVYVDLGQADGVRPGDVLLISRPIEIQSQLYNLPSEVNRLRTVRTAVGEIVVLKVNELASTALVTYSTEAIFAGDSVERR